jgi:asparagine synthase (glutamine-hydrolysing)
MCGIAAMFAYRSTASPVDSAELDAITESMRSRGPDAGGCWIEPHGRAGLGNRRLAIIDLSAEGTQPLFDAQGELVIAFNGEIYNYAELRASLERGGARFHSKTDTEVLLQLYRRDGEGMLGLLRGMYAFAIWDTRERRMFIARDPFGIKPLYYADDGATIRLASETKALLAGGGIPRGRDAAGAAGFFLLGSVPEPFTIHANIRAVVAGTAFHVTEESGRSEVIRHSSIADTFARARALGHYAKLASPSILLRERIEESVAHHLVADVPIGVFLSAGIDSSAITAIASRLSREPLRTFTLAFEEFERTPGDEAPPAERFARETGTVHTTRRVSREEFLADLPRFLAAMDQPTIDGVNTWFVSKAVHESGVKIALSGLGGDELLGGYPSFRSIPRMIKLARKGAPARVAGWISRHPKARHLAGLGRTLGGAYLLQRGLFLPDELPSILGPVAAEEGLQRLRILDLIGDASEPDPQTDFGRVATLEASLYMRNQLLRDADWASMAHSVEVRTPLVDFALLRQVAPTLLENGSQSKQVLASVLPPWLRDRRKTGFFVPMTQWLDLPSDGTTTRMRSWARIVFERTA